MQAYKQGYADVSIGQLHYSVRHNPAVADGSALVLLNSRARSSVKMFALLNQFEKIYSLDLPAFGMSSPMPAGCSMRDIASVIGEAMSAVGVESCDLYGLHSGHKVAAAFAAAFPRRVKRLIIAGRTHSLPPDQTLRTQAMKRTMDENHPDISILRMEGKFVDDLGGPLAFQAIFEANFKFDFAQAMRALVAPTLIVEITSDLEDGWYERQADALAKGMRDVRTMAVAQTDPSGLDLYIGVPQMAKIISDFMRPAAGQK